MPAATTQPAANGFSFGAPATTQAAQPASTGFSLGLPAATTQPAASGFSFGAPTTTQTAQPASTGFSLGLPAATTQPAAGGFSLGLPTNSAPGFGVAASPLKLGDLTTKPLSVAPTSVPTLSNQLTAPTASITAKPAGGPAVLRTKTVEEILNKWTTELDVWTREFQKMGVKVAEWDNRILNGFGRVRPPFHLPTNLCKISALYNDLQRTESLQQQIDSSLDDVEAQQKELGVVLDDYERMVREVAEKELVGPASGSLSGLTKSKYVFGAQLIECRNPADIERENIYALSVSLSTSLSTMSQTLGSIISDVNAYASPGTEGGGDPIKEISAVLDSHLTSLQWIDRATSDLQKDIAHIKKTREVIESSSRLV
jgi:nuclear pore complex protein Nup62